MLNISVTFPVHVHPTLDPPRLTAHTYRLYTLVATDAQLQAVLETEGSDYEAVCIELHKGQSLARWQLTMDANLTTASLVGAPAPGGVFHFLLLTCVSGDGEPSLARSHVTATWHLTNDNGREELGARARGAGGLRMPNYPPARTAQRNGPGIWRSNLCATRSTAPMRQR